MGTPKGHSGRCFTVTGAPGLRSPGGMVRTLRLSMGSLVALLKQKSADPRSKLNRTSKTGFWYPPGLLDGRELLKQTTWRSGGGRRTPALPALASQQLRVADLVPRRVKYCTCLSSNDEFRMHSSGSGVKFQNTRPPLNQVKCSCNDAALRGSHDTGKYSLLYAVGYD